MAAQQQSILVIGLQHATPAANFDDAGLAKMLKEEYARLEGAGYYVEEALIPDPDNYDLAVLQKMLKQREWTAVGIGFGVRGLPQFTSLFERIVNTVVEEAHPAPKLLFQLGPNTILEAAQRVLHKA